MFKKVCLLSLFALSSVSALAGDKWVEKDVLDEVYPDSNGLQVVFKSLSSDNSTCNGGRRFVVKRSHDNYDVMVSVLLTAFASGKNVKLNVTDASSCAPEIFKVVVVNY